MLRLIASLLATVVVSIPVLAQDKVEKTQENERTDKFKAIQEDFKKAIPDAQKELQAAKTQQDAKAVYAKLNFKFSPRILKLVEADPKGDLSFNMLIWAFMALPEVDAKVFDQFTENWAKSPRIKSVCQRLALQSNPGAVKLLQRVLDENTDKDTKGFACFALAKAETIVSEKDDPKAADRAEALFERVQKEYGDVKTRNGKLGQDAKTALLTLLHPAIGREAPNVESESLEGKKVQLKDYRGKVVVLDIWATWCPPCRAMIPHETGMVKKLKGKPFALISISADDEIKTLKGFLEETPMPWVHWWNGPTSGIVKDWNVQFFPTIYVLDSEGVVRYKNVRGQELEDAVEKLLAGMKDKK